MRIEAEFLRPPDRRHLADDDLGAADLHFLIGERGAIVEPEGDIDRQDVEPAEPEDWPGAERPEKEPEDEPDRRDPRSGRGSRAAERAMRPSVAEKIMSSKLVAVIAVEIYTRFLDRGAGTVMGAP